MTKRISSKVVRFSFLDIAGIVAILRVVSLHGLNNFNIITAGAPVTFHTAPFWQQICLVALRFSVPVFVLISGYKFALSRKRHPQRLYGVTLKTRALRLLRPYLIWTVIIYAMHPLLSGHVPVQHAAYSHFPDIPGGTVFDILTGTEHPAYQLWFVPMLMIIVCIYPPIFRFVPAAVSQPVLWLIFLGIRFQHIPIPWMYPAYLAFFDAGARLGNRSSHSGPTEIHGQRFAAIAGVCFAVSAGMQLNLRDPLIQTIAVTLNEAAAPFFIFFLSAALFTSVSSRRLTTIAGYIWPVFILHEPLILGRIGYTVYHSLKMQVPFMYPVVVLMTLLSAVVIIALIDRAGLHDTLF